MKKKNRTKDDANYAERPDPKEGRPRRVRLPGFINDEEIGLGDMIKRTTSYFGIKPCGGCGQRADALNRWLVFTNRMPK